MQATVTGKYFLEERFANFISAVFYGFQELTKISMTFNSCNNMIKVEQYQSDKKFVFTDCSHTTNGSNSKDNNTDGRQKICRKQRQIKSIRQVLKLGIY